MKNGKPMCSIYREKKRSEKKSGKGSNGHMIVGKGEMENITVGKGDGGVPPTVT